MTPAHRQALEALRDDIHEAATDLIHDAASWREAADSTGAPTAGRLTQDALENEARAVQLEAWADRIDALLAASPAETPPDDDAQIGPAGACPQCYADPCQCPPPPAVPVETAPHLNFSLEPTQDATGMLDCWLRPDGWIVHAYRPGASHCVCGVGGPPNYPSSTKIQAAPPPAAPAPSPGMPEIEVGDVVRLRSGRGQEVGVMEALILNGMASKAHIDMIERPFGSILWRRRA